MVDDGERNYRIFYRLLGAIKDANRTELRKAMLVFDSDSDSDSEKNDMFHEQYYHYLNQSTMFIADNESPLDDFDRLIEAMNIFNINHEQQMCLFRIVLGILFLGM